MIKINKLTLIEFGKFKDFSIDLSDGLNIIYGKNESGKSTVQLFIKAMFYGMPSKKRKDEAIKERLRAVPWDGRNAAGIIRLSDGNSEMEIRRTFGKTSRGDKIEVLNLKTGENISEYETDAPGEKIFGISCSIFEKTVWISQNGIFMGGRDEEITSRLMNLVQSGDEEISADKAREYIDAQLLKIRARDKRNNSGQLDVLEEQEILLKRERFEIKRRVQEKIKAEEELSRLINENEMLQSRKSKVQKEQKARSALDMINRASRLKEINEEKNNLKNSDIYNKFSVPGAEEDLRTAESLNEKIKTSEPNDSHVVNRLHAETLKLQHKRVLSTLLIAISAVLTLVSIVLCIIELSTVKIIFIILGLILIAAGIIGSVVSGRKIGEKLSESEELKEEFERKEREMLAISNVRDGILEKYGCVDIHELLKMVREYIIIRAKLEALQDSFEKILGDDNYNTLMLGAEQARKDIEGISELKSAEEYSIELNDINLRSEKLVKMITDAESRIKYEYSDDDTVSDINTQLIGIHERISELRDKYCALEIARDGINAAYAEMKANFAPEVSRGVDNRLIRFAAGARGRAVVSDDFMLRFSEVGAQTVEAEYMSRGAYEQIYFALRLSVAELVCGNEVPLFLDDVLTNCDDERSENMLEYIKETANDRQVILFTCHGRDVKDDLTVIKI